MSEIAKNFPADIASVAIAVSGGIDSMCLTLLASKAYANTNTTITALIVDHQLRPESSDEAAWVKAYLNSKSINAEVLLWRGIKPKANIHQKARKARYDLLLNFCKDHNIACLLTGHNLNDQAETVMMRIFRGSGIDGISGIPATTKINGITIIRPLLSYSREQIESIMTEAAWEHVNDPSNADTKYERTKIRQFIGNLQDNSIWVRRLALLAENALRVRKFLERETKKAMDTSVQLSELGFAIVSPKLLLEYDEEIVFRVIATVLKKISGQHYPPRFTSLKRLVKSLYGETLLVTTLWGCEIKWKKDKLVIFREHAAMEEKKYVNGEHEVMWDNRFKMRCKDCYIGALTKEAWDKVKTQQQELKLPFKKILYTLPATYNHQGNIISVRVA